MKQKRFTPIHLILTVVLTAALTLGGGALTAWLILGPGGLTMLKGLDLVEHRFVGEYQQSAVVDGAMAGMVTGLDDRWSYYLTSEQYQKQQLRRTNYYIGIGVTVSYDREEGLLVTALDEGGGALAAGVRVGDVIVAVDGTSISGDARETATDLITGADGTVVKLTLLDGAGENRTVDVMRSSLEVKAVTYEMLPGKVGYIKVANFYDRSAEGVRAAVEDLQTQGVERLLFDVRNNPGGYLGELTKMLDYLLPTGPIFASHDKNGPVETISSDESAVELPMAVLVNEDTYSAAELFAGQLRESVSAPLIGGQTCGKGFSQQTFPMPNGGALAVSTGAYTTGGGVSLAGVGLTPDRMLENTAGADLQMEAARTMLLEE